MDNIFKEMADLVSKAYHISDDELATKAREIYSRIPSNMSVHCAALDRVIQNRVYSHCKLNKVKPEDYEGPLPFRVFNIKKS